MRDKIHFHQAFPYIVFIVGYAVLIATSYLYNKSLFDWSLTAIENH